MRPPPTGRPGDPTASSRCTSRRSQLLRSPAAPTDRRGKAQFVFAGKEGTSCFILFWATPHSSVGGTFTMRSRHRARPRSRRASKRLPRTRGVRGSARSARSAGQRRLVDQDAGWDDGTSSTSSPAAAMASSYSLFFSRHVPASGERSGAASASAARHATIHSTWPQKGGLYPASSRAIARCPVGAAALSTLQVARAGPERRASGRAFLLQEANRH